ncbi:MAG: class I SAM-dependent methyltransferase [Myxococcota bacterium]|nr:class I SAM-dependent methyltransferase [Deltaproteobacteria bacterium]MDQ3339390.1 class I SAM-dependent methyltransferase [Myxococcota bacterium]
MSNASYSETILRHYRSEVEGHGLDASSTMRDDVTRNREIEAIRSMLRHVASQTNVKTVVDIGCGNGYLLNTLRDEFPQVELKAVEYTPEMVEVARTRNIERCTILQGDVRQLPLPDRSVDVAITERCIINVMDRADQATSLREVARILRPGGYFICVEAFVDGLDTLNAARDELGLPPNEQPHHNMWFDKAWFRETIAPIFDVMNEDEHTELAPPNFLSSHYFISRVLYPSVTKREVIYNTHFVKFFRFLPPVGNYSPIQVYLLRRRES